MVVAIAFTIFACGFAIWYTFKAWIFPGIDVELIDRIYAIIADIIALVLLFLWIFAR